MISILSSPLALIRIFAYLVLLVFHVALFAFAGSWYAATRVGGDGLWSTTIILMYFFGAVSFLVISLSLGFTYRGYSLRLEAIWLLCVTVIWAGLVGQSTKDYMDYYQLACEYESRVYKCYRFKGIFAFVWINLAWTLSCFVACIVFGLVKKSRSKGNASVWKAPLIELLASSPEGAVRMDSRVSDV